MPTNTNSPVDYSSFDASILAVDILDRPTGDIYYRVKPLSYREEYSHNNGSFQQITILVDWQESNDFVNFTLGYTEWDRADPTRLHRVPPMQSPFQSTMYAEHTASGPYTVRQGQGIRVKQAVNYWPDADDIEHTITFRPRLYDMLSDADVDGSDYPWAAHECKELGRYVQRIPTPRYEELKLGNYELDVVNPVGGAISPIPDVGFVPFVSTDLTYIWYGIPEDAVPLDAIDECSGKINDAAFDKKRNVADTAWVDRHPAQTLLFKGSSQELSPHSGPDGERLVDVYYAFSRQIKGWNKFPPPDPTSSTWWTVQRRRTTPPAPLYATADFRTLFKPRTS